MTWPSLPENRPRIGLSSDPRRAHDISPSSRLPSLLPDTVELAPFLLLSSHELDVQLAAGGLPKKQCHIRAHPKTLASPVILRAKVKLLPAGPWPVPLTSSGLSLLFCISRLLSPIPGGVCSLQAPHLLHAASSPTATLSCSAFPLALPSGDVSRAVYFLVGALWHPSGPGGG